MADSRPGYMFSVADAVQGHHVYKEDWTPVIGEVLSCEREIGNRHDPQAVAVKRLLDTSLEQFHVFVSAS